MRDHLPGFGQWPQELRQLVAPNGESLTTRQASIRLPGRLVAQLYPTELDLHAYRVLLVAATGHAPEEVTGLGERDIEFLPSGVRLTLTKNRAQRVRTRRFLDAPGAYVPETDATQATHAFADQPHREVAAIVRRLMATTERARGRAHDPDGRLFVTAAVTNESQLRFGRWNPTGGHTRFKAWIAAAGLAITGKPDIRRMRKTTKAEKAIASGGSIAAAADDHHEQTFRGHYAQGTTLRVVSGRVITSAQEHWLDQALNGPTLVDDAASEALNGPRHAAMLGLTRQQAKDIIDGALDMGVADCKDPYNSPYSRQGELCTVAPLRCFECRHAFLLPTHLPQQLLFMEHLERLRLRLAPMQFDARWGRSYANLQAAIVARSEPEIALARKLIAAGEAALHLPFYADVEFDL